MRPVGTAVPEKSSVRSGLVTEHAAVSRLRFSPSTPAVRVEHPLQPQQQLDRSREIVRLSPIRDRDLHAGRAQPARDLAVRDARGSRVDDHRDVAHRRRLHARRGRRPFSAPDWGFRQQGSPSTCLQTLLESDPHSGRSSRRPNSALRARASARSASRATRRRRSSRSTAAANAAVSFASTNSAQGPSSASRTSCRTSRSLATTGTPACAASTTARPKVSAKVGKTNTSRPLRNCATRSGLSSPVK